MRKDFLQIASAGKRSERDMDISWSLESSVFNLDLADTLTLEASALWIVGGYKFA